MYSSFYFSGPLFSSESVLFWRSGLSQLLVLYTHRENKQGEDNKGEGREEDEGTHFILFSFRKVIFLLLLIPIAEL